MISLAVVKAKQFVADERSDQSAAAIPLCQRLRGAVEVDGAHHDVPGQMSHDARRDGWLALHGVRVMRIAASDVLDEKALEGILVMIAEAARR